VTFSGMTFAHRFQAMGDEAEAAFEAVYPESWVRYGLNRPRIWLGDVPAFVRYTPDYLTARGLVEVQGFGRDQTVKLKAAKRAALLMWHALFDVDVFLWDSHHRRHATVGMGALHLALEEHGAQGAFDDGRNPYTAIRAEELPVTWEAS
jgi:hypothetical protein